MDRLEKINRRIGMINLIGLVGAACLSIIYFLESQDSYLFVLALIAMVAAPFILTGWMSQLDRESKSANIRMGFWIAVLLLTLPPCVLPLFFDPESIVISILGLIVIAISVILRKSIDKQLLVMNLLGLIPLALLVFAGIIFLVEEVF